MLIETTVCGTAVRWHERKIFDSFLCISPGPSTWFRQLTPFPRKNSGYSKLFSCVALTFLKAHPTLGKCRLKTVPPARMLMCAANGPTLQVLGFVTLRITLGDVSRLVDALVIPSLGPDQLLLDNATMTNLGAILDWKRQPPNIMSSKKSIPSVPGRAPKITDTTL